METKAHILVVDDENDIRELLRISLENEGYEVSEAVNGRQALEFVNKNPAVDLIIMDVIMPELSGVEACRAIRKVSNAPVLFLTAKSGEDDMQEAYVSGGDDYLCKPFSRRELLMKARSIIRRYQIYRGKTPDGNEEICDDVKLDRLAHQVFKDGAAVELTEKEYRIFAYLMEHRGETVTASSLYEAVWNEKYLFASGNTVMVHILNLRRKLEQDSKNPRIIRTVWGKGYTIDG